MSRGIFGWSLPPGCGTLPGEEPEDYVSPVLEELKKYDTGRWKWDEIDACFSGKDCDLDGGQVGVKVDGGDDVELLCTAHFGVTHVGIDVCLNEPQDMTPELCGKYRDLYLEQATMCVCGCGIPGYWDGDCWYLSDSRRFKVKTVFDGETGEVDGEATAKAIYDGTWAALKPLFDENELLDRMLNILCGWRNANGHRCKPGKPGPGSVFRAYELEEVK